MALPPIFRRLFENGGDGPKLRKDIIPPIDVAPSIPTGLISMWSGAVATIPTGWALCDGTNGTPNLRDRFIIGAGSTYAPGATGGANTHTHTATAANATAGGTIANTTPAGTVGATTLTIAQMPSHNHAMNINTPGSNKSVGVDDSASYTDMDTAATGGGGSHTHTFTGTAHTHTFTGTAHTHTLTVADNSNQPPYYALAYIMKL